MNPRLPPHQRRLLLAWPTIVAAAVLGAPTAATAQPTAAVRPATPQRLTQPVSIAWQGQRLATALKRLAASRSIAIWLDRRIDPSAPVELNATDQPLAEVLAALGQERGAAAASFSGVVYVGPRQTAEEIATLAALMREQLTDAPPQQRKKWLEPRPWSFPHLSEPRQLLAELAAAVGAQLDDAERIPHDLWPAQSLPAMPAVDRATLLLAGFDLAGELSADGRRLRVAPIKRPVRISRDYRIPGARADAVQSMLAELKDAAATTAGQGNRLTVAARVEDHQRLRDLLANRRPSITAAATKRPASPPPSATNALQQRRFTLTIENKPLGAVVDQLAAQLALQVEWDPSLAPSSPRREALASCAVREVDIDGLLKALLEPAGLTFERQGTRISIRPQ